MTDQPDKSHESVEDLDVPEEESGEAKGGSLNFSKVEFSQKPTSKSGDHVARWNFENAWPSK
jgi:hypothetical protein